MKSKMALLFVFVTAVGIKNATAQLTPEEVAEKEKWEDFLETAKIVEESQMDSREAVTSPWVLTLEKNGVTRRALWKNPTGRMRGFVENWRWEIAAYRLDKLLDMNMVPPTVQARFRGDRGSSQLWMEDTMTLRTKEEDKIETPPAKLLNWNRHIYIQRAFDNLIANEDRHMNQVLLTKDWRMLLIDHSRSFRTGKKFTQNLLFDENTKEGPRPMTALPRAFYAKVQSLTHESIKGAVGDFLEDDEIEAVLLRRDLVVQWIENKIKELGEGQVLYGPLPTP